MSISTSIHFGQLNTSAEGNGYSIYLRLHLSILKTLLASFDEEVFCFATVLLCCLRHAVFARYIRDVNLNSAHFVLAETSMSLVSARISRWHAHPSFPWGIFMLCVHMCAFVSLFWGYLTIVNLLLLINSDTSISSSGEAPDSRPCAFLPTSPKSSSNRPRHIFFKYSNLVKVNYFHRLHAVRLAELQKTRVSPRNLKLQSKQMRNIQVKRPWPTSKVLVSLACSVLLPTFKGIYTMK